MVGYTVYGPSPPTEPQPIPDSDVVMAFHGVGDVSSRLIGAVGCESVKSSQLLSNGRTFAGGQVEKTGRTGR